MVAIARGADAGLRAAYAARAIGRSSSRQRLVYSQKRVLDTGRQCVAAGVRACGIEDGEIERLDSGTVLYFRAQRCRSSRFHGHKENFIAGDFSDCVADIEGEFAE